MVEEVIISDEIIMEILEEYKETIERLKDK